MDSRTPGSQPMPPSSPPAAHGAPRPRPSLAHVKPYVPGAAATSATKAKLNSNENAFGPPPAAIRAMQDAALTAHRYPDGRCVELRDALAQRFGLSADRILCSAGSDMLIRSLCHSYGDADGEVIMSQHAFVEYKRSGELEDMTIRQIPERGAGPGGDGDFRADIDGILAAVTGKTRLAFIANPDNPSGACLSAAEMADLRARLRSDVLLVIDAAYGEYVTDPDYDIGNTLVDAGENVVVIRTFSKIWGLAGQRLGWSYAPPAITQALDRNRDPFAVSSTALAAGVAALGEPGWLDRCVRHNTTQRNRMAEALTRCGIRVWPSQTNFLMLGFGTAERADAARAFAESHGVKLRDLKQYALPENLRVTIGTTPECDLACQVLQDFMATQDG